MYTKSTLLSVLAVGVSAAPAPQGPPINTCTTDVEYKDLKFSDPYKLPAERLSGYQCKSHKDDGCGLGSQVAHTVTITQTINGGASAGLDLTKIFNIGLDIGYSYSWSTSDAKSVSSTVDCPKGFITCGMQVVPSVIKINGKKVETQSGCPSGNGERTSDFEVVAPEREGSGNDDMTAKQTFEACMDECSDTDGSCKASADQGVPKCP